MLRLGVEKAVINANGKPLKGRKTPLDLQVLLLGCVHCVLMYSASPQEPFPVLRGSARRAFTMPTETTHSAAELAKDMAEDICRTWTYGSNGTREGTSLTSCENYCHLLTDM